VPRLPRPNLPLPTFGGKQFWADRLHFRGWRLQQHAVTGHCRLLDPKSIRYCWGPYELCIERLEDLKVRLGLAPYSGEVVVALHGLFRARSSMARLCSYLRDSAEFECCNVSHPSTRCDIATHASNLASIVAGLSGAETIHFVGHSLGNIIVRRYLGERLRADNDASLPAIGRMVMIAPPNQGAEIARRLARWGLKLVLGKPFTELGTGWKDFVAKLGVPSEFGIIAGGRGRDSGYNPLLTGDDDLIVSVAETRLEGATDYLVLPAMHAFIMNHPEVQRQTAYFLRNGKFERGEVGD
jgi:pimeloyl-ACP methyl ester carboxylesterase